MNGHAEATFTRFKIQFLNLDIIHVVAALSPPHLSGWLGKNLERPFGLVTSTNGSVVRASSTISVWALCSSVFPIKYNSEPASLWPRVITGI